MLAFVRANKLNRIITSGGRDPKIGIITTGKSYLDVRQAFDELGIDEIKCNELGIRLYKVGCPWPISRQELAGLRRRASISSSSSRRSARCIEVQVREELYGTANQPVCIGKKDEQGNWLFPVKGALDPNDVAICIGERLLKYHRNDEIAGTRRAAEGIRSASPPRPQDVAQRIPYFCSGCPHNTSTVVPEGMRAYAGIGCHYMAQWMDRSTLGYTHMGGEGANWIGEAPFSNARPRVPKSRRRHLQSFRLYGDPRRHRLEHQHHLQNPVQRRGGDDRRPAPMTAASPCRRSPARSRAEGAKRVVVVTDEPDKYPRDTAWPAGVTIHHRDDLDRGAEASLREVPGVTVLIYDQTCAAEKRRRRKRGTFPDPDKRVIINELVCEGCGDCGVQSNCVSVQPLETEWGRKRTIDQSSCNKDFSCVKGFCPSFVTVARRQAQKGRRRRRRSRSAARLPEPTLPAIDQTYNIIVTGVGGTGIVTIGGILGMAAHLEGRGVGVLDMAGLAQKGGAVFSHIRFAETPDDIHAIRVAAGGADLVLGGDIVVAGTQQGAGRGQARRDRHGRQHRRIPARRVHPQRRFLAAQRAAQAHHRGRRRPRQGAFRRRHAHRRPRLFGQSHRRQHVPASAMPISSARCRCRPAAIEQAIELNGEAVAMNNAAFHWGRRAAVDRAAVEALAKPAAAIDAATRSTCRDSFDETVERRVEFLTAYQNAAYARRYRGLGREGQGGRGANARRARCGLADAVARYLFKLMAYKDEYEVARLYTDGAFREAGRRRVRRRQSALRVSSRAAASRAQRQATGLPRKMSFGPWMLPAFRAAGEV